MAGGWERLSGVEMRAAAARFAKHTVAGRLHVVFLLDGSGSVTEGAPRAGPRPRAVQHSALAGAALAPDAGAARAAVSPRVP